MRGKSVQKDFGRNLKNCTLASVTSVTGQMDRKCNKRNKHYNKNDLAVTISLDNQHFLIKSALKETNLSQSRKKNLLY